MWIHYDMRSWIRCITDADEKAVSIQTKDLSGEEGV